ncbi:low molecular weight phosphatase family protein [Urechidicola croceus]|uniref:Protein-tyrosine-phosphatase n=1 Tax=Urechidicola croceus TaxID=1850246 RepID=A0A1D8P4S6_9FLAO|nr:hypothetical protein [Urechidicola croceus]AOW19573.1 hypothetical protein LPB138_02270 [Urechidicola croceus]
MIDTKIINTKKFFTDSLNNLVLTEERKELLDRIAQFIANERKSKHKVFLNFICTHNSRRSQLAQVWAHYAILFYQLKNSKSFSGGTEETAFHRNTIKTLQEVGFKFNLKEFSHKNPVYEISFKNMKKPIIGFSKIFDHESNKKPFIAITTCSSANENCPFIADALKRFHLPYEDPKSSDNTPNTSQKYLETNKQVAAEMNYIFKQVSNLI